MIGTEYKYDLKVLITHKPSMHGEIERVLSTAFPAWIFYQLHRLGIRKYPSKRCVLHNDKQALLAARGKQTLLVPVATCGQQRSSRNKLQRIFANDPAKINRWQGLITIFLDEHPWAPRKTLTATNSSGKWKTTTPSCRGVYWCQMWLQKYWSPFANKALNYYIIHFSD